MGSLNRVTRTLAKGAWQLHEDGMGMRFLLERPKVSIVVPLFWGCLIGPCLYITGSTMETIGRTRNPGDFVTNWPF